MFTGTKKSEHGTRTLHPTTLSDFLYFSFLFISFSFSCYSTFCACAHALSPASSVIANRKTQHRRIKTSVYALRGTEIHDRRNQTVKTHASDSAATRLPGFSIQEPAYTQKLRPTGRNGETGVSLFWVYFPLFPFSFKSPTQV
jgi:hypothetical protein